MDNRSNRIAKGYILQQINIGEVIGYYNFIFVDESQTMVAGRELNIILPIDDDSVAEELTDDVYNMVTNDIGLQSLVGNNLTIDKSKFNNVFKNATMYGILQCVTVPDSDMLIDSILSNDIDDAYIRIDPDGNHVFFYSTKQALEDNNNYAQVSLTDDHYNVGSIETFESLKALPFDEQVGFYKGNIIKYIERAGHKNEGEEQYTINDLDKAICYCQKLKEVLQKNYDEQEKW